MNIARLFELLSAPSPTGFESRGQALWKKAAEELTGNVDSDAYGNAWATLKGTAENGPRIMFTAHADEIGFTVRHISEKGFLTIGPVGGSDVSIARGRRIRILGDRGDVTGIIGNSAIHLRKKPDEKPPGWEDLFVDIGCKSRDEVCQRGIRVGVPAVYADDPMELREGLVCGRAIDNRVGGWILLETLARLREAPPAATIIVLNTVQEEIGGNGARMAAYRLHPDVAIVLDVTHATDSPGIDQNQHGDVKLGGGPAITHGTSAHRGLVQRVMAIAEREQITLQHEASNPRGTSTDTDDIFWLRAGIPSALISTPLRYMHSPVEVLDVNDASETIRLLTAFAGDVTDTAAFQRSE